ncbi:angiopoietin-4 isoform X2 [Panthera pardus]|uniref:Angiopoietin-4 isoform X2 n=1 Tax=Panthera pardus TaxID=9691 RepID=A0A9W2UIQ7_PANPR|nr:angiopoietin-4 isoform X2 [Panthera pardus]XP_058541143.1 angiopoietin-4 isoform X2 [Neofelis nebulosa]
MLPRPAMLLGGLLLAAAAVTVAQRRGQEAAGRRRAHRVQHGQCSYTFVLPEPEPCPPEPEAFGGSNSLQRDSPAAAALNLGDWPAQRVRQLEKVLENNTQWLQKVLNQTSRMEIQLLETSLSTNKLEKQLLLQGHELHRLQGRNNALETRVQALETQQQAELASLRGEKERLRRLLGRQSGALAGLERSLRAASSNSSLLQRQQRQLLESVQRLVRVVAQGPASVRAAEQVFQDCAEIQRFGANASGVYTIHVANMTEPRKVFCDMEANGGGWTLIQRRENGSVNFQRNWRDYKQGFGDPAGEHWLGNEVMHQLTGRTAYSLRVELQDWEGNEAYAQYEHFQLGSEGQLYRLSLSGYSGSAGRQSSLVLQGTNFSTRDADNDNCLCKCAQMLSGGWWFDACGLSNLNGIYYPAHHHVRKLNGIRWHYFQGPSYSLRATRMMVRPVGV